MTNAERLVELNKLLAAEKAGDNDQRYIDDLNETIASVKVQLDRKKDKFEILNNV